MHLTSASLRTQLITLVCLVTLIPFAVGQWLSYRQTAAVIRENMDEQTRLNLQQMEKTLDATLASYEDLLYQIYTNDTVVELVNKLAAGEDVALSRNQLRREIQEKVFAKPYLGAITVLFEDGSYSTYDKLLASSTSSTWLDGWDSAAMYSHVQPGGLHQHHALFSFGLCHNADGPASLSVSYRASCHRLAACGKSQRDHHPQR